MERRVKAKQLSATDTAPVLPALAAPVFAALGDPTRLALVMRLSDGQARAIAALAAGTSLTRQGVTKHLRVLESGGLVVPSRAGREKRYTLRPDTVTRARDALTEIAAQWDAARESRRSRVDS